MILEHSPAQSELFPLVKIEVYIPEAYVSELRDALHVAGAGRVGHYDHCLSITEVRGYWRPLEMATPFQGQRGTITEGTECKIEVRCPYDQIGAAIAAIRGIHPYEEPLINIVPLLNHLFDCK